jgi:hypothetical protein
MDHFRKIYKVGSDFHAEEELNWNDTKKYRCVSRIILCAGLSKTKFQRSPLGSFDDEIRRQTNMGSSLFSFCPKNTQ